MEISNGLVEQHIHGAFGIDFMNCSVDDFLECSALLSSFGVTAYFPTIMTDEISIIKDRLEVVKQAKKKQSKRMAQIIGVHLEGPFINPEKAGIHEKKYILQPSIENYKLLEDDIINIVTVASELDVNYGLINYLKSKNIKVSVGHSVETDLNNANQVTHLYNAMGTFSHRGNSTVVSALTNENIYCEIIADSMHVSDDVLKLTFKQKSLDKILLISDALPLAHAAKKEHLFAGQKIYNKDGKLVNEQGIFAGSSMLLADIITNLCYKNILTLKEALICASSNQLNYHNIQNNIKVYWNDSIIEKIEFV